MGRLCKMYKKIQGRLRHSDPLYSCKAYKDLGCVHVDGPLCDFHKCQINKSYLQTRYEASNNNQNVGNERV